MDINTIISIITVILVIFSIIQDRRYRKQLQKREDDNRPSNLNFGLLGRK